MTLPAELIRYAQTRARTDAAIRESGAIPGPPLWRLSDPSPVRRRLAGAYYAELIRVDDTFAVLRGV